MQKKLIALAVAGLASSAAFAQSNVTLFGTLRPSYDHISGKDAAGNKFTLNTMNSNSSTIGFKGSEDLGNGLKAIFSLEYNVDLTNENTLIGGDYGTQDMYVGFADSKWGAVKFGALNNMEKKFFGSYDPFAFSIGDYNNIFTQGVNSRNSKAVAYESPTWSGFKFGASYSLGEGSLTKDATNGKITSAAIGDTNETKWSVAADYKLGGLQLTAGYSQGNNEVAGVTSADNKSQRYGVAYTFSSKTKLFGVYGIDKDFKNQGAGGSYNTWMIGVTQPVSNNITLMADYIKAGDDDTADTGAKNYNLGVKYAFSKRTNVQALYSHIKNDANATYGFDSGYDPAAAGIGGGAKASAFSLRMQHSF